MEFYAGNMSLLNDIAQIENEAGRSGSGAAARDPKPTSGVPAMSSCALGNLCKSELK